MSKERLEEIERQLNRAEIKRENLDIEDFQNIIEQQLINGNLKWLVKYAREQSERVQELETAVDFYQSALRDADRRVQELENHIDHIYDNNVHLKGDYRLQEQNKRYRETIEEAIEYANSPKILTSPAGIEKILSKALEGSK